MIFNDFAWLLLIIPIYLFFQYVNIKVILAIKRKHEFTLFHMPNLIFYKNKEWQIRVLEGMGSLTFYRFKIKTSLAPFTAKYSVKEAKKLGIKHPLKGINTTSTNKKIQSILKDNAEQIVLKHMSITSKKGYLYFLIKDYNGLLREDHFDEYFSCVKKLEKAFHQPLL